MTHKVRLLSGLCAGLMSLSIAGAQTPAAPPPSAPPRMIPPPIKPPPPMSPPPAASTPPRMLPPPIKPPPPQDVTVGWTRLGLVRVQGKRDRDVIKVGKQPAKFTKLMLVSRDGAFVLKRLTVKFGNNQVATIDTNARFADGARSNVIDLPGEARNIKFVELVYSDLPRDGAAEVVLWAKYVAATPTPPTPPPPPVVVPAPVPVPPQPTVPAAAVPPEPGYQLLGVREVDGKVDRDTIKVGIKDGRFQKIILRAEGSDLALFDIMVHFGNGEMFSPKTKLVFDQGARTRSIDLPGKARFITHVMFRYGNLPGGGKARIQLWAK